MIKDNLKFKKIIQRKNNDQWQINKFKDENANDMFKEHTNNVNIYERTDINNRWAILKCTVVDVASKALNDNKDIVCNKEWIKPKIIIIIEEKKKFNNGSTLEIQGIKKYNNKKVIRSKGKVLKRKMQEYKGTNDNW